MEIFSKDKDNKTTAPKVVISILNWNGGDDTIECLESLYQIDYQNYDVIVVDNCSKDDSLNKIKNYCKGKIEVTSKFFKYSKENKPIKIKEYSREEIQLVSEIEKEFKDIPSNNKLILIKNEKNYGFTEGNNIIVRYAIRTLNPKYVLFLNNDTVVDKFFLKELVTVAEKDNKIGVLGPKIYFYNYNGRIDIINFSGSDLNLWKAKEKRYGYKEVDKGQYDEIKEISRVDGSCMLVRNVKDLVLFYSDFFAYWEEIDLCFRFKKEGYKILYIPKSKIWHKKLLSDRKKISPLTVYYMTRNRFLFIKRNASKKNQIKFLCYFFSYDMWFWFFVFLRDGGIKILSSFLKGIINGIVLFKN